MLLKLEEALYLKKATFKGFSGTFGTLKRPIFAILYPQNDHFSLHFSCFGALFPYYTRISYQKGHFFQKRPDETPMVESPPF